MEPALIEKLFAIGPWGVGLCLLFLARKEIIEAITAPRGDRAVESLLGEMNRQFSVNMEMFHVTNGHLAGMHDIMRHTLETMQSMLLETARGKK